MVLSSLCERCCLLLICSVTRGYRGCNPGLLKGEWWHRASGGKCVNPCSDSCKVNKKKKGWNARQIPQQSICNKLLHTSARFCNQTCIWWGTFWNGRGCCWTPTREGSVAAIPHSAQEVGIKECAVQNCMVWFMLWFNWSNGSCLNCQR